MRKERGDKKEEDGVEPSVSKGSSDVGTHPVHPLWLAVGLFHEADGVQTASRLVDISSGVANGT
jgi:hypothetical protein